MCHLEIEKDSFWDKWCNRIDFCLFHPSQRRTVPYAQKTSRSSTEPREKTRQNRDFFPTHLNIFFSKRRSREKITVLNFSQKNEKSRGSGRIGRGRFVPFDGGRNSGIPKRSSIFLLTSLLNKWFTIKSLWLSSKFLASVVNLGALFCKFSKKYWPYFSK